MNYIIWTDLGAQTWTDLGPGTKWTDLYTVGTTEQPPMCRTLFVITDSWDRRLTVECRDKEINARGQL
jgi:hypothetical protein